MAKTFMKVGSFLVLFLILFQSCRQELGISTTEEGNRQEEFFKANLENLSNDQKEVLNFLKTENKKTNFLKKILDQEGNPLWSKAIIRTNQEQLALAKSQNNTDDTYIILPLSSKAGELSSVLYLAQENGKFIYNNITNKSLKDYVNNVNIPKDEREKVLMAYLFADQSTYQSNYYTNIPSDLLTQFTKGNSKNVITMKLKSKENGKRNSSTAKYAVPIWECIELSDYDKCTCSSWPCDMCPVCVSTYCSIVWIGGGGGSGGSTGGDGSSGDGGSGGGGTGSGGSGGTSDECSGGAWYRIHNDCDGDGNTGLPEPTPCENITSKNTKAKEFIEKTKAAQRKTEITSTLSTDTEEKGFSYGVDSSGLEQVTAVKNGTGGNAVDVEVSNPNFFVVGAAHTHPTSVYNVPSTGDIYNFYTARATNNKFSFYHTFAQNDNEYAFTIADQSKFDDFTTNYPKADYLDGAKWKSGTTIANDFYFIVNQLKNSGKDVDDAYDLAMAYVLKKYDTGIAMSKKDSNGNYKAMFVQENIYPVTIGTTIVIVKTYESTNTCNY